MRTRLIILLAIAIAAIATFLLFKPEPQPGPTLPATERKPVPDKTGETAVSPAPPVAQPSTPEAAPTPPDLVQQPNPSPAPPPAKRDFENPLAPSSVPSEGGPKAADNDPVAAPQFGKIFLMLRDFRTATGENPVGTNAEIMKSLMGDNSRGAKFGPPEGMELNGDGELIDP
ncbi:MAG TPA: hypothetical protein VM511_12595, partial [Luteolibacter sp.]|nr:hypothetical protein [Luteolibacter sp.]